MSDFWDSYELGELDELPNPPTFLPHSSKLSDFGDLSNPSKKRKSISLLDENANQKIKLEKQSKTFKSYIKLYEKLIDKIDKIDKNNINEYRKLISDLHLLYMSTEYDERDLIKKNHDNLLNKVRKFY